MRRRRRRSTCARDRWSPATRSRRPGRSAGSNSGSLTVAPAAESGEARRFSFGNGVRLVYDPPDSGIGTTDACALAGADARGAAGARAAAQGARGALRRTRATTRTQPVEITSDRLDLDQAAGTAVFTGSVKVGQGTLRLAADRVEVFYDDEDGPGTGGCSGWWRTGNVTLSNGTEAAEADQATYEVAAGTVEMEGDVLLTQGRNALSSETLRIDLERRHRPARGAGADDLRSGDQRRAGAASRRGAMTRAPSCA